ncbi:MAG: sigma-54-dependent transcriptional regulator [Limisphaerales bacterium]
MADQPNILVVDDDARLRTAVGKVLVGEGYRIVCAASGQEAMERLKAQSLALIILDLFLPDSDGLSLLKAARELQPEAEVVMVTAYGSVEKAVAAMRLGAYDFIEKPIDSKALLKTVAKALEKQRLSSENRQLRRRLQQSRSLDALIGCSPAIEGVKALVRQVAPTNVTVLIEGESGTGKEIVADALHSLSERRDRPLLKLSCAAIPEALLESELFGYERGAFTGAAGSKPGRFELADSGTLFLDEIAEMSSQLQAKLLRVLQDGQFQRLGGTRNVQTDVRFLAATHADIPRRIADRQFRDDLYYRINTVQVSLSPLRERREDIPLLAAHFLSKAAAEMAKPVRSIAPKAMRHLMEHRWPGNVRELEHVMQQAVALAAGDTIEQFSFAPAAPHTIDQAVVAHHGPEITIPIGTTVEAATKQLVEATLEKCGGNKLQASHILGVPARTMYRHFSDPKRQRPPHCHNG